MIYGKKFWVRFYCEALTVFLPPRMVNVRRPSGLVMVVLPDLPAAEGPAATLAAPGRAAGTSPA